jgi:hypothetical protein
LYGPSTIVCANGFGALTLVVTLDVAAPDGPGAYAVDTWVPFFSVTVTLLLPKFGVPGVLLIGAS